MLCFVAQKVGSAGSPSQIITDYLATDTIVSIPLVQRDLFKKLNRVSRLVSRKSFYPCSNTICRLVYK